MYDICVFSTAGPHITINGKECINLATFNFLGLLGNSTIKVYTISISVMGVLLYLMCIRMLLLKA